MAKVSQHALFHHMVKVLKKEGLKEKGLLAGVSRRDGLNGSFRSLDFH